MVKRPYKVRNSRETKHVPEMTGTNRSHNAPKRKAQKNKSNRHVRRFINHSLGTMTEAINDGRYGYYDAKSDSYKPRDTKPVRRLYNPPDNHLFSIRDLLSDGDGFGLDNE